MELIFFHHKFPILPFILFGTKVGEAFYGPRVCTASFQRIWAKLGMRPTYRMVIGVCKRTGFRLRLVAERQTDGQRDTGPWLVPRMHSIAR